MLTEVFESRRIVLVLRPVDMRCGANKLRQICESSIVGVDLGKYEHVVIFASRHRNTAKIIWMDEYCLYLLTVYIRCNKFSRILCRPEESGYRPLTKMELLRYLRGYDLLVEKHAIHI